MHFKCDWLHRFKNVKDEHFYLTPNNQVTVKMMSIKKNLKYYHDDYLKFAALQLPYEVNFSKFRCNTFKDTQLPLNILLYIFLQDHAFSMIILLPDTIDGLKNLENNLSKIKLDQLVRKMTKYTVDVKLPRFKMEQSLQLKKTLSNVSIN